MAITEAGECKISYINQHGLGLSNSSSGRIILPYTLKNEIVKFERHAYRRTTNCILKEIISPSSDRIKPECKYFGACGGCLLQHMNEKTYLNFKEVLITKLLSDAKINTRINNIITIPPNQRRKVNFKSLKKAGEIFLGLNRYNSHQIVNISACPAILESLSNLINPLKNLLKKFLGEKQKAEIFITQASNGIDMAISTEKIEDLSNQQKCDIIDFAQQNGILKIDVISALATETVYKKETPYVIFDDVKVEIDAQSFLQATCLSDKVLSNLVLQCFEDFQLEKQIKIADLFCGRGTFTIPLSRIFEVDGFESDIKAVTALQEAIFKIDRKINLSQRDLFLRPLTTKELNQYQGIVINPPRSGAEAQCRQLKRSRVKKICYVSCNPETFTKDIKILEKGGYKLLSLTPVDQFYWTSHLEVVGVIQKQNQ